MIQLMMIHNHHDLLGSERLSSQEPPSVHLQTEIKKKLHPSTFKAPSHHNVLVNFL